MIESIKDEILSNFNTSQQFLVKLLCEYYEEKLDKDEKLNDDNLVLLEENEKLQKKVFMLQEANNELSHKLRSANNMIRILSKTEEDGTTFSTPKNMCLHEVDRLIKQKLNEEHIVDKLSVSNIDFKIEKEATTITSTPKSLKIPKKNQEVKKKITLTKLKKESPKKLKNSPKKLENSSKIFQGQNEMTLVSTQHFKISNANKSLLSPKKSSLLFKKSPLLPKKTPFLPKKSSLLPQKVSSLMMNSPKNFQVKNKGNTKDKENLSLCQNVLKKSATLRRPFKVLNNKIQSKLQTIE